MTSAFLRQIFAALWFGGGAQNKSGKVVVKLEKALTNAATEKATGSTIYKFQHRHQIWPKVTILNLLATILLSLRHYLFIYLFAILACH